METGLGIGRIVLDGDPPPCLLWPNSRPSQQLLSSSHLIHICSYLELIAAIVLEIPSNKHRCTLIVISAIHYGYLYMFAAIYELIPDICNLNFM